MHSDYSIPMEIISSRSNSKIREARALKQRKKRGATSSFLVEGIHLVGAAVEAGAQVESIFYAPALLESQYALNLIEQANSAGLRCYPTTAEVFTSLATKEHPQGILAVVYQPESKLSTLNPEIFPWGVACVSPQDPGNVGTILRTVDAVGASGLILLDGGVDAFHPTAVRASMGSVFRHPVSCGSFSDFVQWSHEYGYQVVGTSAHGLLDYRQITDLAKPLVLLLGDEKQGLSPDQRKSCHMLVGLPMHGKVTSLNLAVAAGIMLYSILDQLDQS